LRDRRHYGRLLALIEKYEAVAGGSGAATALIAAAAAAPAPRDGDDDEQDDSGDSKGDGQESEGEGNGVCAPLATEDVGDAECETESAVVDDATEPIDEGASAGGASEADAARDVEGEGGADRAGLMQNLPETGATRATRAPWRAARPTSERDATELVRRRLILLVAPPQDDPEGHDRLALLKQPAAIDGSMSLVSALQLTAAALDEAARARHRSDCHASEEVDGASSLRARGEEEAGGDASATSGGMRVPSPSVIAARVPRQACVQSSQYRGVVCRHKMSKRTGSVRIIYEAIIRLPRSSGRKHLGTFTVEEHGSREAAEHAAARAYDKRARELYGEVGSCGELFFRSEFKMTWIAS